MPITYGSVCSGIEAATVAWHPLGWRAAWYAEIEPFPCAVLAHHYPAIPNHGDMTRLAALVLSGKIPAPDVLVGGTPCQAFSVAGMREGLNDPRGALTIKYVELLDAIDHVRTKRGEPEAACVWENVPGVLSDKGNAFGCFLGALVGESAELKPPGGKWKDAGCVYGPTRTVAWRVLDAQYFGLAQRRRRVFVVASARAGFDPLEVLFEREGLRRDTAPRRGQGQDVACTLDARTDGGGFPGTDGATGGHVVAPPAWPLSVHGTQDPDVRYGQAHTLGRNNGMENAVLAFAENSRSEVRLEGGDGQVVGTLSTGGGKPGQGQPCIAFQPGNLSRGAGSQPSLEVFPTLKSDHGRGSSGQAPHVSIESGVRRLTPCECERLQGFPDDYTLIPYRGRVRGLCPDGPRYKAIGNSKAVPVVRWIGQRLQQQLERPA